MDAVENSHGFDAGEVVTNDSPSAPSWAGSLFAAEAAWTAESSVSNDFSSSSSDAATASSDESGSSSRSSDNS